MLYADGLCIVSLSSAGLPNLLSICDKYCASHSITFNIKNQYACFSKVALTLYNVTWFPGHTVAKISLHRQSVHYSSNHSQQ